MKIAPSQPRLPLLRYSIQPHTPCHPHDEGHFAEGADGQTRRAVLAAKAASFGVSIHAGEDRSSGGTAANVRRAIEDYGATRIGLLDDETVLEIVRDRGVHTEACPTSSWLTGGFGPKQRPWAEHPVRTVHPV